VRNIIEIIYELYNIMTQYKCWRPFGTKIGWIRHLS